MILGTIQDIIRSKLIKKHYGIVTEEDSKLAKELLSKIDEYAQELYQLEELLLPYYKDESGFKIAESLGRRRARIKKKITYYRLVEAIKKIKKFHKVYIDEIENIIMLKPSADTLGSLNFSQFINDVINLLNKNYCEI